MPYYYATNLKIFDQCYFLLFSKYGATFSMYCLRKFERIAINPNERIKSSIYGFTEFLKSFDMIQSKYQFFITAS